MVSEEVQVSGLDDGENGREQRQAHHNADIHLGRQRHLQFPKDADRHDGQYNIRHRSVSTDEILVTVENIRTPACATNCGIPQHARGVALEEYNKYRNHGNHHLQDGHAEEEPLTGAIRVEEFIDEDGDRDIRETECTWTIVRSSKGYRLPIKYGPILKAKIQLAIER